MANRDYATLHRFEKRRVRPSRRVLAAARKWQKRMRADLGRYKKGQNPVRPWSDTKTFQTWVMSPDGQQFNCCTHPVKFRRRNKDKAGVEQPTEEILSDDALRELLATR